MLRRVGGVPVHFEESPQILTPCTTQTAPGCHLHARARAAGRFLVNCPKFKAHPLTTVTFGCKNYIGLQDDAHRRWWTTIQAG